MSIPTDYQVITHDGKPAFVLVPVDIFDRISPLIKKDRFAKGIPQAVVEAHILRGESIVKAWREHLGFTQVEIAQKSGMKQSAIARLETTVSNPRKATLKKLAKAMKLTVDQLAV